MTNNQCWAVVPAAGIGKRMGSEKPKQYLVLAGKTVIEHAVQCLLQHPLIQGVIVALHPDDKAWQQIRWDSAKPLLTVTGGRERADSVVNALNVLAKTLAADTWILVHDAARPCVRSEAITRLIQEVVSSGGVGGILGTPVRDTMKRSNETRQIVTTVAREHLWQAQTPQMFRLAALQAALQSATNQGLSITDEASAMELAGFTPLLVEGGVDNLKITQTDDLMLASFYLSQLSLSKP